MVAIVAPSANQQKMDVLHNILSAVASFPSFFRPYNFSVQWDHVFRYRMEKYER